MANNNKDTTTTLGIDISQFKRGLQDAQRQIKLANAEFKAAAAGMDKWSDSATGVQAKIKQLETTLDAENKKLELQKQRLIEVEREQGKNSAGANELRIAIANQQASIAKTEKSLSDYNGKLKDLQNAENQAKTATGALTDTIGLQQNKLDALKQKYTDVVLAQGANSKEAKALGAQISALSGDLATNKQKLSDAENAADKLDKSLTDVGDAATEAGKDAENAANGGFTVLKGVMANLATQAINAALDGLKNIGSALINVGKQAVANYAEYEQLAGGIETLFGAGGQSIEEYANSVGKTVSEVESEYNSLMAAQDTVMQNAANAYKTAGMSANEYMENVTSFSASLISSLDGDTEAAARAADQAIIDMSDNANKMGSNITDIQNAYQGFAKQNYTMLDNLKLGYGGTKEEMERLLADAEELSGVEYDISNLNDVYEAIHVVQTEMGITGTTAREAAETIEGSANAMKASWQNLLTGIADENADLNGLINNFIDSLLTYADNIMPVIQTAIGGITTLITRLVHQLLPQVLTIISDELPNFLNAGAELLVTLITGIVSAMPRLTGAILDAIGMIITTISDAIPDVVSAFTLAFPLLIKTILSAVPDLLDAAIELLTAIVDAIPKFIPYLTKELPRIINKIVSTLNKAIPTILNAGIKLLTALLDAIPVVIQALMPLLPQIITSIVDILTTNIPVILNAGIDLLMAIVQAIPVILTSLVTELPTIINQIVKVLTENIPVLLNAAIEFLMAIVEAIPEIVSALVPVLPDIINAIITVLIENIPLLFDAAFTMFMSIVDAIPDFITELIIGLADIVTTIIADFIVPVRDIFKNLWKKIKEIFAPAATWFNDKFTDAKNRVVNVFKNIGSWFSDRWNDIKDALKNVATWFSDKFTDAKNRITSVFSDIGTWFKDKFNEAWTNIKNVFEPVGEFFGGIWDTIKEKFTNIGQNIGDAVSDAFSNAVNSVLSGATNIINGFIRGINAVIGILNDIPGVSINRLSELSAPQLERGGILKRGQVGLLEGNGAEAVVPLDQNKKWINATARAMNDALSTQGVINNNGGNVTNNYNFTQNNTSPKALSRLEIYRQTKNQFNFATGATGG